MQEARAEALRAGSDPGTALGRAVQILAVTLTENTLTETLEELLGQRMRLLRGRAAFQGDLNAMLAGIYRALDRRPGLEPAARWRRRPALTDAHARLAC